jgi:uncharacterized protein (DUF2141 family)
MAFLDSRLKWPTALGIVGMLCTGLTFLPLPRVHALPKDGAAPAAGPQAELARIKVVMTGFRSDQGKALVALFRKGGAFPQQPQQAEQRAEGPIERQQAEIVFDRVAPGELALSVLHDEDNDRNCRIGLIGIPKEGLGFSRNVRARFGPPDFADAKLDVQPGAQLTLVIHMRYYGL